MKAITEFCAAHEPDLWAELDHHDSTKQFLTALNLPSLHPFCEEDAILAHNDTASFRHWNSDMETSLLENFSLAFWMVWPSIVGLSELVLRILAGCFVPLGAVWDAIGTLGLWFGGATKTESSSPTKLRFLLLCGWSILLATDRLFAAERNTLSFCFQLFVAEMILMSGLCQTTKKFSKRSMTLVACLAALAALHCFITKTQEDCLIEEGFYYQSSNMKVQRLVDHWPSSHRTYETAFSPRASNAATPWMQSGDWRTVFPYLLNSVPEPPKTRVWLSVGDNNGGEEEVVALDISFPKEGHNTEKTMFLVLHGLNGGSSDEYVKDFTRRSIENGSTVVTMVARGYMGHPLKGLEGFHGARWQDAFAAAKAVKWSLSKGQLLVGVGYSMGGIVLNNMVSQAGADCPLDAAITISASLDLRRGSNDHRARRMWHPFLAAKFRQSMILGSMGGQRLSQRLSQDQVQDLMMARDLQEIDDAAMAPYSGYRDRLHYYSEASVLGDMSLKELEQEEGSDDDASGPSPPPHHDRRVSNISIPLCVVHALDDPILTWRGIASNTGFMHPENLVQSGKGLLMMVLTKTGGHVGWPTGWLPHQQQWKWTSNLISTFADAVTVAHDDDEKKTSLGATVIASPAKRQSTVRNMTETKQSTVFQKHIRADFVFEA